MRGTDRDNLAAQQETLVRALLTAGQAPAGFDTDRVTVQARALHAKRREVAAKIRPDLADRLDVKFPHLFDTWAQAHPKPADVTFRADLDRFESWLYANGHLEPPRRRFRQRRTR